MEVIFEHINTFCIKSLRNIFSLQIIRLLFYVVGSSNRQTESGGKCPIHMSADTGGGNVRRGIYPGEYVQGKCPAPGVPNLWSSVTDQTVTGGAWQD